jgi:hypothetical protein
MPPSICLSARGHARIASPSGFVTGSKGNGYQLAEFEWRGRMSKHTSARSTDTILRRRPEAARDHRRQAERRDTRLDLINTQPS